MATGLGAVVALAVTALAAATANDAEAAPPANASSILRIHPGGGPARFGGTQTVEVEASRPNGSGLDGVAVDFELTGGPGDLDGNTPQTPDMTCTTAGGDAHHPATCTASYGEPLNAGGSDGVLAWIDADGLDATVEADLTEGENENAPGDGPCAPGTKGAGDTPEPDATDCAEKRWQARVAAMINLDPKASSGSLGTINFAAAVRDQFGDALGRAVASPTTISFELLAGSAHDPGDGTDFSSPDLGSCVTGVDGTCSIPFTADSGGTDTVCAYLPGKSAACSQTPNAADTGRGGAVVTRAWEAPAPAATGGEDPATPPTTAPLPSTGYQAPAPAPTVGRPATPKRERTKTTEPSDQSAAPPPRPRPRPRTADRRPARQPVVAQPSAPARSRRTRGSAHPTPRSHRRRPTPSSVTVPTRRRPDASGPLPAAAPRADRPERRRAREAAPRLEELSEAALETAQKLTFPLALMLLVIAFLVVQSRLDRRDAKLRLAPIDSRHDLVPFN